MSAKTFWQVLGLDGPTSDSKAIRRAYAAALRETRPDDDPEGFMALRGAFEQAKRYASFHVEDSPPPESQKPETPQLTLGDDAPAHAPKIDDGFDDDDGLSTADYLPEAARIPPQIVLPPAEDLVNPKPAEVPRVEVLADLMAEFEQLIRNGKRLNSKRAWDPLLKRAQDLDIDDYNNFEHQLRGKLLGYMGYHERPLEVLKGAKRSKRKRQDKAKPKLQQETGVYIFKYLGWNRWKSYPSFIQDELLWMLYELGIKTRPKVEETGKRALFSELRYVLKAFGVVLIFILLGNYFEPPEDNSSPPAPLPDAGQTTYGTYSYDRDTNEWDYRLSGDNEALRRLKPGDILRDNFEIQPSDNGITTVLITITGTGGKPDITNLQVPRKIKEDPEAGWYTVFYLIAVVAGLIAIARLFGFIIGVIAGLFGLLIRLIGGLFRSLFQK